MFENFVRYFFLVIIFSVSYPFKFATAQVVPDNTLGAENSIIRSIDDLRDRIEGGAARGDNLFHSFKEFSIKEGFSAEFSNPDGIENIFSRVTGNNISELLGTLGVDGGANLFLMNSNGIVFGENAVIDVGGSFMATTAESIEFDNGDRFSTINPSKPQITINFPIGLGFGSNPGGISVRGEQNNVQLEIPSFQVLADELPQSIEVNSGENISLIGGSINFEGGGLQASQGNIEIVGVSGNQTLKLLPNDNNWFVADINDVLILKDIIFNNAAYVNVGGEKAGNINISGRTVTVDDGSAILADTSIPTNNVININASELLEIKGSSGNNELNVVPNKQGLPANAFKSESNYYSVSLVSADVLSDFNNSGTGNNINIKAKNLKIFDAGQIRTVSFSNFEGTAGNINVESRNILVKGTNNIDGFISSVINSTTGLGTGGNGGNLEILTSSLEVRNGGKVKADTFSNGFGGTLSIEAESIILKSEDNNLEGRGVSVTGLSVSPGRGNGVGGNLDIKTKDFVVSRAEVNSSSFGEASAGDINIETNRLFVTNEGIIRAETSSRSPGNINVTAKSIKLDGSRTQERKFIGGFSTSTLTNSPGNGGDITINTDSLEILNGSVIRAISLGEGDAGNINVNARLIAISGVDRFAKNPLASSRVSKINTGATRGNGGNLRINSGSIELDNLGIINASSIAGDRGGNIDIDTSNLVVRGQSQIAASAGGNDGNGGNININSNAILGIENSDIVANAVGGNGGNIVIDSDYILGLDSRSQLSALSDINASSELGLDGDIQIIDPKIFNGESIISFEQVDVNSSQKLISKSCFNNNSNNAGVVSNIGSGGMPENPENYFDREPLVKPQKPQLSQGDLEVQDWQWGDPIVEANIVKTMPDGTQYLASQTQLKSVREKICKYST